MDYLGNGRTRTTQTGPDGTQSIQEFQSGRSLSTTVSNATLGILQQQTTGYDAHNRPSSVTDLRTGTTSFTFDNLDRVLTVTTPRACRWRIGPGDDQRVRRRRPRDADASARRLVDDQRVLPDRALSQDLRRAGLSGPIHV